MDHRILICGENGAGKSTLGRYLARTLNYRFFDIEDYWFPKIDKHYIYGEVRPRDAVCKLLLRDLNARDSFVLAAVKADFGNEVISRLTCAVYVDVLKPIRLQRIRERSFQKFGERMLPGGDLYEDEKAFFTMVEGRPEQDVESWLETLGIPVLRIDGTEEASRSIESITRFLDTF